MEASMARKPDTRHVLPLFCDDLIASTVDMTPACFGAYMRLICYAWTRGGLPNDERACDRIAGGMEPGDWDTIRPRLIELDDGRLSHDRLERERAAVDSMAEKRSEAGRKGNDTRWGSQTDRKAIANGSQSDRKAIANESRASSDSAPWPVDRAGCRESDSESSSIDTRESPAKTAVRSQSDRKRIANGSQSDRKTIAPTPTLLLPKQEERQYARADGETPQPGAGNAGPEPGADGDPAAATKPAARPRRPGWVHDEWARIVEVWNATDRAVPWTLVTPPNGFADLAASPGWVAQALAAVAMLPECRRFERPVPWTQFVRDLDRIIAGEFRDPREAPRQLAAAGGRPQRRGNL
jgi:uncharacterized protein YdaU (DUF1376 family)